MMNTTVVPHAARAEMRNLAPGLADVAASPYAAAARPALSRDRFR